MNIENLKKVKIVNNQREVKNHKELCRILEEPYCEGGKEKINQIKDFRRYFNFTKESRKPYFITDIYEVPLPKIDGRKSGNHKVYAGNIDIALKWLYQQNKLYRISTTQLGYYLKMLPEEVKARYKDSDMLISQYEEELSKGIPIDDFDEEFLKLNFGDAIFEEGNQQNQEKYEIQVSDEIKSDIMDFFFSTILKRFRAILMDNLKRMMEQGSIDFTKIMMLVKPENKYEEATKLQEEKILQAIENSKKIIKSDFKYNENRKISNEEFYEEMNKVYKKVLFDNFGVLRYYYVYNIEFINDTNIVTLQEFEDATKSLQKSFYRRCRCYMNEHLNYIYNLPGFDGTARYYYEIMSNLTNDILSSH